MKFGIFYEHQLPRPWGAEERVPAPAGFADADRARRQAGLRLRLGGRASLPRGVFALLGAGSVPRRRQPAHQAHPARPWRDPAHDQQPASRRREGGDARSAVGRPRRTRHGRGGGAGRAASLQHPRARQARALGGGGEGHRPDVHQGELGVPRPVLRLPGAQRDSQAVPEAASAALGRLLEHPDHRQGGRVGHGRARLHLRDARGGARLGAQVLQQPAEQLEEAHRLSEQSQRRDGVGLHVRAHRRGSRGQGRRLDLLHLCAVLLRPQRRRRAGHVQPVGRVSGVARRAGGEEGARIGPDRLARDDPQEAAPVPGEPRRPGDPAQPGRQDQPSRTSAIRSISSPAK